MPSDIALLFIELGLAILGLAVAARVSSRLGFSTIPLYLLAGLAFGKGGIAPLPLSQEFIHVGAEIGVLLLLFMLGLEYTGEQLKQQLQTGLPAGLVDLALNFPPGVIAGYLLGWGPLAAVLLGGVTYISSSGVIAKILADTGRLNHPETPAIMSVLVLEDLAMAAYLPLVAVLIAGGTGPVMVTSVAIAVVVVAAVLFGAIRYGQRLSRFAAHQSDEVILLSVLGAVLLVAGLMQRLQVSAAIGAFLVGTALSGPIAEQSHRLLAPLRDLFAATFFFFFGLEIDPASLLPVLPIAVGLGVFTALTKVGAGYWSARRQGVDSVGCWRAGVALVARGEFSIVIAGLGAGIQADLGPIAAAYVLLLAIGGPIFARLVK
ncbi:MAG: cation:proton antiporter [Acidobacteriota bacterium]